MRLFNVSSSPPATERQVHGGWKVAAKSAEEVWHDHANGGNHAWVNERNRASAWVCPQSRILQIIQGLIIIVTTIKYGKQMPFSDIPGISPNLRPTCSTETVSRVPARFRSCRASAPAHGCGGTSPRPGTHSLWKLCPQSDAYYFYWPCLVSQKKMEWCLLLKWNYLCISLLLITANRYTNGMKCITRLLNAPGKPSCRRDPSSPKVGRHPAPSITSSTSNHWHLQWFIL